MGEASAKKNLTAFLFAEASARCLRRYAEASPRNHRTFAHTGRFLTGDQLFGELGVYIKVLGELQSGVISPCTPHCSLQDHLLHRTVCFKIGSMVPGNAQLIMLHCLLTNIALTCAILLEQEETRGNLARRQRRRERMWVAQWLQERQEQGAWQNLIPTLARTAPLQYKNTLRIDEGLFEEILERIQPYIQKETTRWRLPIEPGLRLAITLRFLATGDSYVSLGLLFRVHRTTIGKIIYETCEAIIRAYLKETIKMPTTPEGWKDIARGFSVRWNFEHALGAIDGKHIRIVAPARSGSYYFNYKGYHSMVLLGVVDADYKFIYVSVGANGATCDAQVFFLFRLVSRP